MSFPFKTFFSGAELCLLTFEPEYRQKHPEATTVYVEEESQTGVFVGGTKGQLCYCEIGESAGHAKMPVDRFPAPGHGIGADGVVPMFPRKKDARQCKSASNLCTV